MSETDEDSTTYDYSVDGLIEMIGTRYKSLDLSVVWKTRSGLKSAINDHFDVVDDADWDCFKKRLTTLSGGCVESVTYVDSDGDEIPVESQSELDEMVRTATRKACGKPNILLVVGTKDILGAEKGREDAEKSKKRVSVAPAVKNSKEAQAMRTEENLGDTAPKWFTNYMQTMKEDIVTEVSRRVTNAVVEALLKNRGRPYEIAVLNDSDCPLEMNREENRTERCPLLPRGDKNVWTKPPALILAVDREKKPSEPSSSRAGVHRYENSRRRDYRHAEKQRKKHNKNHVSHNPGNIETFAPSLAFNRRRAEKTGKKRDTDESPSSPRTFGISSRSEKNRRVDDFYTTEENTEEADTPYRRMMTSAIALTSFTPVDTTDGPEAPVLKLRLASPCRSEDSTDTSEPPLSKLGPGTPCRNVTVPNVETKITGDEFRMGCSVTGQDMLGRLNDAAPTNYDDLSDSDNISIISEPMSHASDMQRINDSFEMILQRSTSYAENDETHANNCVSYITGEFDRANIETDDPDSTRDYSCGFEVLSEPTSEPPSPALSIRMDEDHFAPGEAESSNYNINEDDDTTLNKRGNQSKIEIRPFAIDAHGKIYQPNIVGDNSDEVSEEIVLAKRSGGAYSFIGETLPGSTKESLIIAGKQSDEPNDDVHDAGSSGNSASRSPNVKVTPNADIDSGTPKKSSDALHESSRGSRDDHTVTHAEYDRQGSAATSATGKDDDASSYSHIFVDRNASKGLGDTKRTSPQKQRSAGQRSTRKQFNDSHASAHRSHNDSGRTDNSSRTYNPRQGERNRRFGNWSATRRTRTMDELVFNAVDPMHILPETLVTGAVHVASSAYSTARRVYDKILTAQTRKPVDKSKFGRR